MYHTSDTFGYQYDDTEIPSNSAGSLLFTSHTLLVCGIMAAYVTVFGKFWKEKFHNWPHSCIFCCIMFDFLSL